MYFFSVCAAIKSLSIPTLLTVCKRYGVDQHQKTTIYYGASHHQSYLQQRDGECNTFKTLLEDESQSKTFIILVHFLILNLNVTELLSQL